MLQHILTTILLIAAAISAQESVTPIVYVGTGITDSDYVTTVVSQPNVYRNKATLQDTIIVDVDTVKYFTTPRIMVVGFYTTYRGKNRLIVDGMEIITTVDDMQETIKSKCDNFSLVNSPNSKCMAYTDSITGDTADIAEAARIAFVKESGCEIGHDCLFYPLSATDVR